MLLEVEKNTKNKSNVFAHGFFVSIVAIMLSACANHAKEVAGTTPVKPESSQVKAYTVIPAAKPATPHLRKAVQAENSFYKEGKTARPIAYLSTSERAYKKVGRASWYGAAFNGRLTANGEIYDMHNLTAAHPTMPLPSYARVTNLENGASIIVRVNDRGPFAADRVIDLSKQAATMLDYKDDGLADVKVEYVGRAPIEGNDNEFLMASYKPGNITPETLLAMAGVNFNLPTTQNASENSNIDAVPQFNEQTTIGTTYPDLPDVGPLPAFKPENSQLVAFADQAIKNSKDDVFNTVLNHNDNLKSVPVSKDSSANKAGKPADKNNMKESAKTTVGKDFAKVQVKSAARRGKAAVGTPDDSLELAWATGVSEAFSFGSLR
ncbi:septal ring lytic transglycosylase RlpA family protein [Bartonella sp. W8122]|uniref:septal ring lytic transglycosylase RlpA family protein n=1 Tax=Bartonella sp. W8122 TaxID=2750930 RepID=UPI001FED5563|nr:septal ring lytic transglycosylase RlpA family protein [Bartonella sp. W8122]